MTTLARQFSSLFTRRGGPPGAVEMGARYRRVLPNRVIETAEVLTVKGDVYGIPHVTFRLRFEHPSKGSVLDGPRVLALSSFASQYPERVSGD
ncbi:MAG: hypothetical protein RIE31_10945 [Alphaproteobacteria bacterium]